MSKLTRHSIITIRTSHSLLTLFREAIDEIQQASLVERDLTQTVMQEIDKLKQSIEQQRQEV